MDSTDKTKVLTSITCTKTVANDRTGIFAVCGITANGTPSAVLEMAATDVTNVSFNANWDSAATATSYYIDVSTTNDFSHMVGVYNNYNTGHVTTFNVTNLSQGTKYYYRVRGANSYGQGPNSNIITVTTTGLGIGEKNIGNINLYPDPNDGQFNIAITTGSEESFTISVYNNLGIKIYEDANVAVNGSLIRLIDLGLAPDGMYTVIITGNHETALKKFIVKR
jgi:hypothetical protein